MQESTDEYGLISARNYTGASSQARLRVTSLYDGSTGALEWTPPPPVTYGAPVAYDVLDAYTRPPCAGTMKYYLPNPFHVHVPLKAGGQASSAPPHLSSSLVPGDVVVGNSLGDNVPGDSMLGDNVLGGNVPGDSILGDTLDPTIAYSLVAVFVMGEQGGVISATRGAARDIILSAGDHVLKVVFTPDGQGLGPGLAKGQGLAGYNATTSRPSSSPGLGPSPDRVEASVRLTVLRQKTMVVWDKPGASPGTLAATSPGPHAVQSPDLALALGSVLTSQHLTARVVGVGTVGSPPGDPTSHFYP